MEFEPLIRERYSCRSISDRPVEPEKIAAVIEAGRVAPTAVNRQPVHVWHLDSERSREAVAEVTKFTFGAPEFLLVGADPSGAWVRPFDQANGADVDGAIVATHMMLEIVNQGLASTWVGFFDAPRLKELLPETAGYDLVALFPVGYAAEDAEPSERHGLRKATDEFSSTI